MKRLVFGVAALAVCLATTAQAEIYFDWVTVRNPHNPADTEVMVDGTTGYGSVDHTYRIGKYEVTNRQYIGFLNAVAAVGDPNGLYNPDMAEPALEWVVEELDVVWAGGGRIGRAGSGTSGDPWVYSRSAAEGVTDYSLDVPVNLVSWRDAARFSNWLHNGQPTGGQDATTTEDGAYDMSLGDAVFRKDGADFFLPTDDQWYKAAYYDPVAGLYYDYPTGSDTPPRAEDAPGTDMINGSANCGFLYSSPGAWAALNRVGSYDAKPSTSPYGTFDQGGNVWEWNETAFGDDYRGLRGGGWDNDSSGFAMHASRRWSYSPTLEIHSIGFRVATVGPPPIEIVDTFGEGMINREENPSPDLLEVGKSLSRLSPFDMVITVNGGQTQITIEEEVMNKSAWDWLDFHFELGFGVGDKFILSGPGDGLSFASGSSTAFATVLKSDDVLDFQDGLVPTGSFANFPLAINLPGTDPFTFTLRERATVPEPSTFVLALLGALCAYACYRRQRWVRDNKG